MAEENGVQGETLSIFSSHSDSQGQDADTPTADDETTGQGSDDTPADTDGREEEASGEETSTSKEKSPETEKKEKPPPYDQDPKWKAARAAEARLDKVSQKYGFKDHDEFFDTFHELQDIKDVLGKRDLTQLIRDSRKLYEFEAEHGDLEKVKGLIEDRIDDDDDDEEVKKLKQENLELRRQQERAESKRQSAERQNKAIEKYTKNVEGVIADAEFSKDQQELVSLIHGLGNPAMEVDIEDQIAVKRVARSLTKRAQNLINAIRQDAIDQYAEGKSNLIPKTDKSPPKKEVPKKEESIEPRRTLKSSDVDNAFDRMNQEFASEIDGMM